ncbi:MAG: ParA family protein, partial [Bacteroidales bacterium]
IALAHQKGGVGKSVIATLMATELAKTKKVALLDVDQQASIYTRRKTQLANGENVTEYSPELHFFPELDKVSSFINTNDGRYDYIILDTPGYITEDMKQILYNCDFIFIPITAGDTDWESLLLFISLIRTIKADNTELIALFNKVSRNRKRWKDLFATAPEYLEENEILLPGMRAGYSSTKVQYLMLSDRDEYQNIDTLAAITDRRSAPASIKQEVRSFITTIINETR